MSRENSKKSMLTSKISDKKESRRAAIVTPLGKLKPGQDIFILIDKDNQEELGHDGEILRANISINYKYSNQKVNCS